MRLQKWIIRGILVYLCLSGTALAEEFRRLSVQEYVDKMKAGWIGQMVGVGWGAPTEFRFTGSSIRRRFPKCWYSENGKIDKAARTVPAEEKPPSFGPRRVYSRFGAGSGGRFGDQGTFF